MSYNFGRLYHFAGWAATRIVVEPAPHDDSFGDKKKTIGAKKWNAIWAQKWNAIWA